MKTLRNTTTRIFNLPARRQDGLKQNAVTAAAISAAKEGKTLSDVETFAGGALEPGKSIDVPDWYFEQLRKEKNWGPRRMSDDGTVSQSRRIGAGSPEDLEAARRAEARRKAGPNAELEARLAQLEKTSGGKAAAKAQADDGTESTSKKGAKKHE